MVDKGPQSERIQISLQDNKYLVFFFFFQSLHQPRAEFVWLTLTPFSLSLSSLPLFYLCIPHQKMDRRGKKEERL